MAFSKIGLEAIMDMSDFEKGQREYDKGLTDMNKRTKSAAGGIAGALGGIAKVAGGMLAAGAIKAIGGSMVEMIKLGGEMGGVKAAFEGVGGSIERMREGSYGMVEDIELMKSFNQAAQLVSVDFAKRLPDAMQYLSKTAAATGQDMGFMIQSLVTGVGRVSPMILDNLGIQVNLTEATEEYAASIGKEVKALSKTEQQTAVMNKAMELLARNTANMPPIVGTAAQSMAVLDAQLKNLRTGIGAALAPMLNVFLAPLAKLATKIVPLLTDKMNKLSATFVMFADNIGVVGRIFGKVFSWIGAALGKVRRWIGEVTGVTDRLQKFIGPVIERFNQVRMVIDWVRERWDRLKDVVDDFLTYVGTATAVLKPLHDTLVSLGVSEEIANKIASIGHGVQVFLWAIKGGLDPILALQRALTATGLVSEEMIDKVAAFGAKVRTIFANVSTYAYTLKKTFKLGGLDALVDRLSRDIVTGLRSVWDILATQGPVLAAQLWTNLQAILNTAWAFLSTNATAIAGTIWTHLSTALNTAWAFLSANAGTIATTIWTHLKAALTAAWAFLSSNATEIAATIWAGLSTALTAAWAFLSSNAATIAGQIWAALKVGLSAAWEFLTTDGAALAQELGSKIWAVLTSAAAWVVEQGGTAFESIKTFISETLPGIFGDLQGSLDQITMPEGLQSLIDTITGVVSSETFKTFAGDVALLGGAFIAVKTALAAASLVSSIGAIAAALNPVTLAIVGVTTAVVAFGLAWNHNVGGIQEKTATLRDNAVSAFEGIRAKIAEVMPVIKDVIQDTFGDTFQKASASLQESVAAMGPLWESLKDLFATLKPVVEAVAKVLGAVLVAAIGLLLAQVRGLVDMFSAVLPRAIQAVTGAINIVTGVIKGFINIVSLLAGVIEGDTAKITAAWQGMKDSVEQIVEGLGNVVQGIIGGMIDGVTALIGGMIDGVVGFFTSLYDNLVGHSIVWDIVNGIIGAFAGINLLDIGKDMIGGLAKGIKDAASTVLKSAAESVAGWLPGWVKQKLGIASESKEGISIGKDFIGGVATGVEDATPELQGPLGNVMGLFDQVINWLTEFATAIGGKSLYDAAESMEDFADGVEDLSNAFVNIAEAVRLLKVGEISVDDIYKFLDTYEMFAREAHARMLAAYKQIGDKDLKRGKAAAVRLGQALDAISTDLTAIKPGDISQIGLYFDQMDYVLRRTHEMVSQIAKDFGPATLVVVAGWAEELSQLFVLLKAPLKDIEPAEARGFAGKVTLYFDQLALVMATIREWLGQTTAEMLAQIKLAAEVSTHATAIFSMIKSGVDALASLAEYEPVTGIPAKMESMKVDLLAVLNSLTELAADFEAEGVKASAEILSSARSMLGIIKEGIDALTSLVAYEAVEGIGSRMTAFADDIYEVVRQLNSLASDLADSGVDAAATILQSATAMVGFIQPGIDAISALTKYEPVRDVTSRMDDFSADIWEVIRQLNSLASDLADAGVDAAATILQSATTMLGFIVPGIDALQTLSEYQSARDLLDRIGNFSLDMFDLIDELVFLAGRFVDKGVSAAAEFSKSAQEILGLVVPGIEALDAIAGYETTSDLVDRIRDLQLDLLIVIANLDALADVFVDKGLDAAATFADYAQRILGLVRSGTDAMQALAEYETIDDIVQRMHDLQIDIFLMVANLELLSDRFVNKGLDAAAAFASSAIQILSLIGPGIESLRALGEYTTTTDLVERIGNFSLDMFALVDELVFLAERFVERGVEAAAAFASSATTIVGLVKPGIEAMSALAEYTSVFGLLEALQSFSLDMYDVIDELIVLAERFEGRGLEAAAKFASSATTMIGLIKPGVEALGLLATYASTIGLLEHVRKFSADMYVLVDEIITLSEQFSADAVAAAAEFAGNAKTIVDLIKPAIDGLAALAKYTPVKQLGSKFKLFRRQLDRVLKEMQRFAKAWEDKGLDEAIAFAETAKGVIDAIKPAIDGMTELAKYQGAKELPARMRQFGTDLDNVLQTISWLSINWLWAIPDAQTLLRSVVDVVDQIEEAIDAIVDLASYEQGNAGRAVDVVDTELRDVAETIIGWIPTYQNVRAEAKRFATIAGQIVGYTLSAIDSLTGAFGGGDSIMGSIEEWPDAMGGAFSLVMGHFEDFAIDWGDLWQELHDKIFDTGTLIIWMGEAVGLGSYLVNRWELGFDAMIVKVQALLGETMITKGLSGIQAQLQWINDNVANVATVFVGAFARMETATKNLADQLDRVVTAVGAAEDTGGLGGDVGAYLSAIADRFLPKKKGGGGGGAPPVDIPPDSSGLVIPPIPPPPGGFPWEEEPPGGWGSAFFSSRARYDPGLQSTASRNVTVSFGDVTINDVADMASFANMIRSEVRDAIGA